MVECHHEAEAHEEPVCPHLHACATYGMKYVRRLTGVKLETELLCEDCAARREQGGPVEVLRVCGDCHSRVCRQIGSFAGVRGSPEIRERLVPFDPTLRLTPLPKKLGRVVDLAPIADGARSVWLLLLEDGTLVRWDADSGDHRKLAQLRLMDEDDPKKRTRLRVHASSRGEFAAVCRDYGRTGVVLDLRSGKATLSLDGGDYHQDTVPLSLAFAEVDGRVVVIHRTAWNRLDLSDAATGELLSAREKSESHALDYFHGAVYVSPDGRHLLDDGWVWHPVGIPMVWDLERWRMDNPWESENGPSKRRLCVRSYCWDRSMAWLDDRRIVLEGLGDDDLSILPGARIFDITVAPAPEDVEGLQGTKGAKEIFSFPGPTGHFIAGRNVLYAVDEIGLSLWDPAMGERTGRIPGFSPGHRHPGANELAGVVDGVLVRWRC